ncbi:hypothetical protein Hanom_Chr15g01407251 [Helianthus anomalus]
MIHMCNHRLVCSRIIVIKLDNGMSNDNSLEYITREHGCTGCNVDDAD